MLDEKRDSLESEDSGGEIGCDVDISGRQLMTTYPTELLRTRSIRVAHLSDECYAS